MSFVVKLTMNELEQAGKLFQKMTSDQREEVIANWPETLHPLLRSNNSQRTRVVLGRPPPIVSDTPPGPSNSGYDLIDLSDGPQVSKSHTQTGRPTGPRSFGIPTRGLTPPKPVIQTHQTKQTKLVFASFCVNQGIFVSRTDPTKHSMLIDWVVNYDKVAWAWTRGPAPRDKYPQENKQEVRRADLGWGGLFGTSLDEKVVLTSERAALFAALRAQTCARVWSDAATVVIGSSSEYFVRKASQLKAWSECGWKTAAGRTVENKDLWSKILAFVNGETGARKADGEARAVLRIDFKFIDHVSSVLPGPSKPFIEPEHFPELSLQSPDQADTSQ